VDDCTTVIVNGLAPVLLRAAGRTLVADMYHVSEPGLVVGVSTPSFHQPSKSSTWLDQVDISQAPGRRRGSTSVSRVALVASTETSWCCQLKPNVPVLEKASLTPAVTESPKFTVSVFPMVTVCEDVPDDLSLTGRSVLPSLCMEGSVVETVVPHPALCVVRVPSDAAASLPAADQTAVAGSVPVLTKQGEFSSAPVKATQ
jgi:hypothetical protein